MSLTGAGHRNVIPVSGNIYGAGRVLHILLSPREEEILDETQFLASLL